MSGFRTLTSKRRPWRLLTVILSLWAVLFAQTALAQYACHDVAKALEAAQMTEARMPCAEAMSGSMDDEQPALCHAHCQTSHSTADHSQPPSVPALAQPPVLWLLALPQVIEVSGDAPLVQTSVLRRWAAPPLAISHCCFRI